MVQDLSGDGVVPDVGGRASTKQFIPPTGITITPDDGDDLPRVVRGIYVGSTGNVKLITPLGDTLTFTAVPAGELISIAAKKVLATGTTAGSLVGVV